MSDLLNNVELQFFYDIYADKPSGWRGPASASAHSGLLTAVSRLVGARYFVELGTGTGIGTRAFLRCARETDGHVWSIDHEERLGKKELEGDPRVTFVIGDTIEVGSRTGDWAKEKGEPPQHRAHALAVSAIWGKPDVVYVDSDHSYAHALAELRIWSKLNPKVVFADDTMDPNEPWGSPIQAVHDFCEESGWRYINVPVATGLAILVPPE